MTTLKSRIMKAAEFKYEAGVSTYNMGAGDENSRLRPLIEALARVAQTVADSDKLTFNQSHAIEALERVVGSHD